MVKFRALFSSALVAILFLAGLSPGQMASAAPSTVAGSVRQAEVRQPNVAPTPPGPENALPRQEPTPTGGVLLEAKRAGEQVERRTATTKSYRLADGRTEVEVSAGPVHYRDAAGNWQEIDTRIAGVDARSGFAFASERGLYRSYFGAGSDRMVKFQLGERQVELGLDGPARGLAPKVDGNSISYPDAAGDADVAYEVTPQALKEKIVLDKAPATAAFTFSLRMAGVEAKQQVDGSIAFYRQGGEGPALFFMPKPFMYDSRDSATSPYGKAYSDKVTQTLKQEGDRFVIVVTADDEWLRAGDRKFPVVIDPTIKIQPTPTQSQDVMINSDAPGTNYDGNWRLSVGATTSSVARSLLKFDLAGIPAGTRLDSAQLQTYYDQDHTTGANDVAIEARRVTAPWTENTATWNSINAAFGEVGQNAEQVDNGDTGKTAVNGEWPVVNTGDAQHAIGGTYRVNRNSRTGETFAWVPRLTEPGEYQVEAHNVAAADRATNAPFTVFHAGGEQKVLINQSTGADGVWQPLGKWGFNAGTSHKIVLGDVANRAVVADAVRLTKLGVQLKKANKANVWHSFSVRSTVQDWLNGTHPNHGFMLKAADEALGKGGPRYAAAEFAYNGESAHTPKLLLTYGRPGVSLDAPTRIRATGADLSWSQYRDPSTDPGDDLVEYQVHRSVFQNFRPSAATLVAPIKADRTSYNDTTATPTRADDPQPFGSAFYYVLAVKTRDGQLIPSQTQLVRLPKAGRVVKVVQGDTPDTTLTAKQPDGGHDQLTGEPWLMVGNSSATFGAARAVVKFPNLGLPAGARVVDTELGLWGFTSVMDGAIGTGTYELHGLTRDFDEAAASWNRAGPAAAWSAPGGDFDPAIAGAVDKVTNDPTWRTWKPNALVQKWVNEPASNRGALIKLADESKATERTLFLSSEAAEPELRPRLLITYTEQTAENTYYAPTTPDRMIPGDEYTVPVTITNTTGAAWPKADWALSYHWALPDGTDYTNPGNRAETLLPADIPVDDVSTVDAKVKAAIPVDLGNKRESFILKWDLRNTKTGKWLSEISKVPPLAQNITVEDPTSNQLGLEKFYQYTAVGTGAGSTAMVNQFAGNAVWSYNAFSHPSRGPATFLRMTYNSQDTSNSYIGYGWSLSTSTTMRLGSPLEFYGWAGPGFPQKVVLADGDGTRHQFELNKHNSGNPADWDYDKPAGVHSYLQRNGGDDATRMWVMTRPDRTQFFFDTDGYQTATVDKNGNEMQFTYERSSISNRNTGVLRYITDATGRRTLNLEYYAHGDPEYDYYTGDKKQHGTNLANGKIANQLKAISDITGRRVEFVYSDRGLLQEMTDGAGTQASKKFMFFYDNTWLDKNPKLLAVTDPRGHSTGLTYHSDPSRKWKVEKFTDRKQKNTSFDYRDPDGDQGSFVESTVTDARNNPTTTLIDGYGRPTKLTNAKNEKTELTWDTDNNVRRLEEDNKAVFTWVYDPNTGFPVEIKDAEANAANGPPTKLAYHTGLKGHVADLNEKTSPEGRKWQFTYDGTGNLVAVTDPMGTSTPTEGDYTSTYAYDDVGQLITATDANDNATQYRDYDATGYPTRTIDPYNRAQTVKYDALGNVLQSKDAKGKTSEFTYDVFARPLTSKTPLDADNGKYIFTPGPEYDPNDNVIKHTAAESVVNTATYDATDHLETTTAPSDTPDGPAKTTRYGYDDVGNFTSRTDPKGVLTPADPNDFTTRYEYDQLNRVTGTVDALKNRSTNEYDNVGNVITVVDPIKVATADLNDFTSKYGYDRNHRVTTVTDAAGSGTSSRYDRDGNVIESTAPDANNANAADPAINTTLIKYDARSMVEEQWAPWRRDDKGAVVYHKTRNEYDEVGNKTRVITPRGMETADDPDDFAHVAVYDKMNRVVEQWTAFDKDDERVKTPDKTFNTYDEVGNLTEVSAPPSAGQTIRNVTRSTFLDTGWVRSSTDPWNITTAFAYDSFGNQTSRTLTAAGGSASREMKWTYYPDGKTKTRSDDGAPVGRDVAVVDNSDPAAVVTGNWGVAGPAPDHEGYDYRLHNPGTGADTVTWNIDVPRNGAYEVFVRYTAAAKATNATYTVEHDGGSATKVIDQTQQAGQWVSLGKYGYTEDQIRKIILSDKADGTVVADAVKLVRDGTGERDDEQKTFGYAYDPNNNLVEMTDTSPGSAVDTYTIGYNGLNQVEKIEEKLKNVTKKTTGYTYDANGNAKTRTHNAQNAVYEYDVRDLLTKVTNTDTGPGAKSQVTTFGYTPRSQKKSEIKANGNTVDYDQYYPDSRLRHSIEKKADGTTVVAEHTLDYDANGQLIRDASRKMNADNHTAAIDEVRSYTIDPRDRLRKSVKSDPGGKELETETYVHDANNNVIEQTLEGKTTRYTYDRNRLITAQNDQHITISTYDPYGRLDKVTSAGKLVEKYRYDGFDRVAEHQKLKEGSATERVTTRFTYDPMDRTTTKTEGDKKTVFAYLGLSNEVLTEETAGKLQKSYQYSPSGERLSQTKKTGDNQNENAFYGYNPHTDVETLTDDKGDAKATYGYTAYGSNDKESFTGIDKPDPQNPAKEAYNPYRYSAKRWDGATGTYDMGFRNYSPDRNAFLNRDSFNGALDDLGLAIDPWTGNRYAFAGGNPASRVEIDGHEPRDTAINCSGFGVQDSAETCAPETEEEKAWAVGQAIWWEQYKAQKEWVRKNSPETTRPEEVLQDLQGADYVGSWWDPKYTGANGEVKRNCFGRAGCQKAIEYLRENKDDVQGAKFIAATYCVVNMETCERQAGIASIGEMLLALGVGAGAGAGRVGAAGKTVPNALEAARTEAAALLGLPGRHPTVTTAAVDRVSGQVWFGGSGNPKIFIPPELAARLPKQSLEPWSVRNCGEVAACAGAISHGAKLENLEIVSVYTRTGIVKPPCRNCERWVFGDK
ncbi:DNRLRE domain-containing protein [Amycolatopsis anabasis]|uniref:golvesin C-terminal-like domain-containing protein n=1 Tax=Amycolatopsis anabasis TaxID=1840409 RepID=UPI00131E8F4B|nr:DNRLRE domain-containing protein [Amycolatopsis anabasis]